jgi:hypothetical protein
VDGWRSNVSNISPQSSASNNRTAVHRRFYWDLRTGRPFTRV